MRRLLASSLFVLLIQSQHATSHSQAPSRPQRSARHRELSASRDDSLLSHVQPGKPHGTLFDPHERTAELNRRFLGRFRNLVGAPNEEVQVARRLECEPGCLHGGTCELDPKTKEPTCLCPEPDPQSGAYYRGSSCQTEAVRCSSAWWCENGGRCLELQDQQFTCECPATFQGLKCQTPVTTCGNGAGGLWCANGGSCVFSAEANSTICKCPSTHSGANCETLEEPQELGPPHTLHSPFKSPVVVPPETAVERLEDEQQMYFKAFFLIFGVFLTIWVTALAVVHCPRPRHELKRRIRTLRGELTPLRDAHKQQKHAAVLRQVSVVERLPGSTPSLPREDGNSVDTPAHAGQGEGGAGQGPPRLQELGGAEEAGPDAVGGTALLWATLSREPGSRSLLRETETEHEELVPREHLRSDEAAP